MPKQYFDISFYEFFLELSLNNQKSWFDENRKRYENEIKQPFIDFIADLLLNMSKFDSGYQDLTAKDCLFRINKDIRFSKDKSPSLWFTMDSNIWESSLNFFILAIFQNTTCLYTSDSVENEIIEQIIKSICLIYNKKINDVIEILGFVFYREDFEKSIGCKIDEIVKNPIFCKPEIQQEDIIQTKVFDIDELLDKISQYGLPALTPEEIDFLDNYSNDKRN